MSAKDDRDQEFQKTLGLTAGAVFAYFFLLNMAPHVFLAIPAGIIAFALKWAIPLDEKTWRKIGFRALEVAVLVTAIYVFFCFQGLDFELLRFLHQWKGSGHSFSVAERHPWAVLPPCTVVVLLTAACAFIWRRG